MPQYPTNEGRAATETDVKRGVAVFHIPDGSSQAYESGRTLPARAEIVKSVEFTEGMGQLSAGTIVEVIQLEVAANGDVLVGFLNSGENGICLIDEIRFLEG